MKTQSSGNTVKLLKTKNFERKREMNPNTGCDGQGRGLGVRESQWVVTEVSETLHRNSEASVNEGQSSQACPNSPASH